MLIEIPERGWIYRILGIDNGTDTVGFVINDHDLRTGVSTIVYAETLTASLNAYERFPGRASARGKAFAREGVIAPFLMDVLEEFDPDIAGCESPFSHLNIRTYRSLSRSMGVMDDVCFDYRPALEFVEVPPGVSKKAACNNRRYSSQKEVIQQYLLDDPAVVAGPGVVLENMDEHCFDGTAVTRHLAFLAMKANL